MHLVHQNIFEFDCASKETGKEVQKNLSSILEKEFYPKLEILLDQYEVENHFWKIENLTLELPKIKAKNWQQDLCKNALEEMEKYLKSHHQKLTKHGNSPETIFHSDIKIGEKLFFQFLKSGLIPENTFSKNLDEISVSLDLNSSFLEKLTTIFEEDFNTVIRYYFNTPETLKAKIKSFQFEKSFPKKWQDFFKKEMKFKNISDLEKWISSFETENFGKNKTEIETSQEEINENKKQNLGKSRKETFEKNKHLNTYFTSFNKLKPETKELLESVKEKLEPKKIIQEDFEGQINLEKFRKENKKEDPLTFLETIYIENAGLVILHPFLKALFEQTNLLENENWISKESQHKGILLTQFLVNGKTKIFENELVLNKLICGLPIETVVNTKLILSDFEMEKCKNLLEAVLEYWKPLQGSSVETLQETFLQRNGKLSLQNNNQELWVEEKGVDILLEQLPWGIGTIKTPWMTEFLICNWR